MEKFLKLTKGEMSLNYGSESWPTSYWLDGPQPDRYDLETGRTLILPQVDHNN